MHLIYYPVKTTIYTLNLLNNEKHGFLEKHKPKTEIVYEHSLVT